MYVIPCRLEIVMNTILKAVYPFSSNRRRGKYNPMRLHDNVPGYLYLHVIVVCSNEILIART